MKEIGVAVKAKDMQPTKLADATFKPEDAEKYATSFAINSLQS